MAIKHQGEVLFEGEVSGEVLRFDAPISFWGGVNPQTAKVSMAGHPQLGNSVNGKILVISDLIGSSSSSAIVLELLYRNIGPKALILGDGDAILPIGVLIAAQMDWTTCPVVKLLNPPFETGDNINIFSNGVITSD